MEGCNWQRSVENKEERMSESTDSTHVAGSMCANKQLKSIKFEAAR